MQLWNNDNKPDKRKNVHLKTKLEKKMRSNKLIFFLFLDLFNPLHSVLEMALYWNIDKFHGMGSTVTGAGKWWISLRVSL